MSPISKIATALALSGGIASANAALITNLDGSFDFGGFDWASNGSIWVRGYDVVANPATPAGFFDNFTLTYMANAAAIQNSAGIAYTALGTPGINITYEYTIFATVQERVTCLIAGCSVVQIDVLSGVWDVYYNTDTTTFFNPITGLNPRTGDNILSGTFAPSPISQSLVALQGATNPGNVAFLAALQGSVTFTDTSFISPELTGTTAVSTLQFGNTTTSWTRPTSFDGVLTGVNTNTDFVGQADANQSFRVPEPGTLALLGIGLALGGLLHSSRRASKASA